ncbi:MAG: hypothetical protein ABJF89_04365 [Parasphingorhabdus sp.]|uniref:hypothetical protein n=2 Tax=Parasphingorhabdus sp. TaxID=2709688 RepID=UPI0032673135
MKLINKRSLSGCLVVIILLVGTALAWASFEFGYMPRASFDVDKWKLSEDTKSHPRLTMVDSLIESGLLDGKSREDVFTLLGHPPETGYFRDWDAVYWLGPERGFIRIDSEWLVIRFDDAGRVSEYQLMRD